MFEIIQDLKLSSPWIKKEKIRRCFINEIFDKEIKTWKYIKS